MSSRKRALGIISIVLLIAIIVVPATFRYWYGVSGNRHVILAVNVVRDTAAGAELSNVQITLPFDVDEVEVLDEGRTIPVINGTFTDYFPPFGVHIYIFTE